MADTVRTFLAIELDQTLQNWLSAIQQQLRVLPSGAEVRWVNPENIHLTLRFMGETHPSTLPQVRSVMDRVGGVHAPIALIAAGLGCFPNMDRPRVVWVGVSVSPELSALNTDIEDAIRRLGFANENRPFAPHLTLGRVRDGLPSDRLRRLGDDLRKWFHRKDECGFTADTITFFQSELRPGGAAYSVIQRSPLKRP
jgi:RNA 2',3'-cyclic 3'-phosphodiesterase